jgi:ubiquinone/menaquinone biosynthesis C-methylase UbiE
MGAPLPVTPAKAWVQCDHRSPGGPWIPAFAGMTSFPFTHKRHSMTSTQTDPVKQQVAAHWGRRAASFDEDFGHSIRTEAERAAWDRIFNVVLAGRGALDALDAGCGTGFLSLELAARGHRVTGIDFAPAMLAEAERKAAEHGASIRFEEADAEQLPFASGSFDLVISRHVLWTLPHPEAAIDEWIRVLRPGGRLAVIDGQFDPRFLAPQRENARTSTEYATIGDQLPFLGGRPREEIETLFKAHGLVNVGSDPVSDLVEAQAQRMVEEGRERQTRRRYVACGDVAG